MKCLKISIKGIVQGVGFRPFVFNLAHSLSVKGFIANTADGVIMTVEGDNLELFVERIRGEAPPLAKIMDIDISPEKFFGFPDFLIQESSGAGSFTLLSPDVSVCDDCLDELFDSNDRRFFYPFINCTNCGPRYSITKQVPYDRQNTTMSTFGMCEECLTEYDNPEDRRFHAQPNACHRCGPQLELLVPASDTKILENNKSLEVTQDLLVQGKILAVKGLGGFHIACDATNSEAVRKLRERKRRSNKPFALMAPDIETIRKYCMVSEDEEKMLLSNKRPIVLLQKLNNLLLPEEVAPNNKHIGFMLPYTPLHYLLFRYREHGEMDTDETRLSVLVMTSGNLTEEPLIHDNEESLLKLSSIADAFLLHNRDIFMRVDDSVIKVRDQGVVINSQNPLLQKYSSDPALFFIRRSRGYVPGPIPLFEDGPDVLGCGADLKNTFTITKGNYAIPSQHIGDMENYETLSFFEETLRNLKSVYKAEPEAVAYDLHPHYMSTQWALRLAKELIDKALKTIGIQHHYAHIGSVMAENSIREKVIGVAFDGNGYGEDGSLWGGEFLLGDVFGYKRAGHIKYAPLPGGDMAAREPWRMSISYLNEAAGDEIMDFIGPTGFIDKYGKERIEKIIQIASDRKFSPLSSSAGRLFDAVAALIGICDKNTFEGEAAIALESFTVDGTHDDYPLDIRFKDPVEIDFSHTILKIIDDMERGTDKHIIATKFHNTVASAISLVVLKLSLVNNIRKVILSGGVFQNAYLLGKVTETLKAEALSVYVNEIVPCNDAGISLGQAYIARERIKTGTL
jgi:hydrogenase maturation protein HypF